MNELIEKKLEEIETSYNVKILYAIESGSRAWGFPSPDSDYDVRFIYVRAKNEYLKLNKSRDVIEYMLNDVLDINGWDLDKTLRLFHSSNPTLFEWCSSPIIYRTTPYFENVKNEVNSFFLKRAGLNHYLNMAEGNYREYLKGEYVKIKKYFYVLRPILACKWIIDKSTPPPMLFDDLIEAELDHKLLPVINNLLEKKRITSEMGEEKRIDILNDYIEDSIACIKSSIACYTKEDNQNYDRLNELFLLGIESNINF